MYEDPALTLKILRCFVEEGTDSSTIQTVDHLQLVLPEESMERLEYHVELSCKKGYLTGDYQGTDTLDEGKVYSGMIGDISPKGREYVKHRS